MGASSIVKSGLQQALRRRGYAIVQQSPEENPHLQRTTMLAQQGVELVLDGGANVGQYGGHLRDEGYRGRIVSFEPLRATYEQLEQRIAGDAAWTARRVALGERPGTVRLRSFADSRFNSALDPVEGALEAVVAEEEVEVVALDALEGDVWRAGEAICLKLDVQGLEAAVLRGAPRLLASCRVVEAELSTVPTYEGQSLLPEVVSLLHDAGLRLATFRPLRNDGRPDSYVQQADALFVRT